MNITLSLLKSKGACADQVRLFRTHFGEGPAGLDDETALRMASVFDFDWAAQNLLSPEGRKAYEEARAPLLKTYVEARAPLRKTYDEAVALAFVAIARKETA